MSKLDNARLLQQNRETVSYIPVTLPLSKGSLSTMLDHFPFVYLKPDNSCQGKGLFRVDRLDERSYKLRSRDYNFTKEYQQIDSLWSGIQRFKMKRRYIIQEGISSVTRTGRLFDIRVHLMRLQGSWQVVGMVSRLAASNRIATNAYSGGKSKDIKRLLINNLGFNHSQVQETKNHLVHLSLQATRIVSNSYPKWSEFGLDIGMDQQQRLWIYEINIKPGLLVFKNLNQNEYHRLLHLRKQAV